MRRRQCPLIVCAGAWALLGIAGLLVFGITERVVALEESAVETAVDEATQKVDTDWNAAMGYTCGGLLSATDERVLMAYERRVDLDCGLPSFPTTAPPSPSEWCTLFDEKTGACIGKKCELIRKRGVPDRTLLSECNTAGSCTVKVPHESCKFSYNQSRKRIYDCQGARAECYSYFPDMRYSQSYYPFAYNCLVKYAPVPAPSEPRGQPQLIPPYAPQLLERKGGKQWEPTPRSNVTVLEMAGDAKDSSDSALVLDDAALKGNPQVLHPTVPIATRLGDYPDLLAFIGELADPPQVRLILPSGGLSLRHRPSALFERIFSSLRRDSPKSTVSIALGSDPEALTLAAEYLEDIPLFEVRYVPLKVQAPSVSEFELYELAKEWKTWIAEAEQMGNTVSPAVTLDGATKTRIENDIIKILQSYTALQNSIREYRLQFPQYMHALLSNVESANKFFSEQWVAVNKARLQEWYQSYHTYLPQLQARLRTLQAAAATYTAQCLVPACRLDVVPVKPNTKPWELIPENMELTFADSDAAFLPEGPPVWANAEGRVVQWHPQRVIGTPLPDLTLDFSELMQSHAIDIPIMEVEWLPLSLPYPPTLDAGSLQATFESLAKNLRPLPRLTPPLPILKFPTLRIPHPVTSLFLVPEPPVELDTWTMALDWREKRLKQLQDTCDTAASPTSFLAHEFQLYSSRSNPAALRAATFVPGEAPQVGLSSYGYFLGSLYASGLPGGVRLPPLVAPPPCSDCGTVRPQRYIRQHVQMEQSFSLLQDQLLRAVDEWNAQVKFVSVVPRAELENIEARQPETEDLFSSPK